VILPVVEEANKDLKSSSLAIRHQIDQGKGIGLELPVVSLATPQPSLTGRSLAFNVIDGQVTVYRDGGSGRTLGPIDVVTPTSIEDILTEFLRAVGYDQEKKRSG
jgi:hypothetical protein